MLLLDAYGGADSQRTSEETREVDDDFDYVWDQHRFDPIHHHVTNFIHFEFPDGSRIKRAFRYDWRLWSIPEIRELLQEAGFYKSEVYWEGTDRETGEGNDVFSPREQARMIRPGSVTSRVIGAPNGALPTLLDGAEQVSSPRTNPKDSPASEAVGGRNRAGDQSPPSPRRSSP